MTDNQNRQSLVDAFDSVTWRKLGRWKKSFMLDCIEVEGLDAQNFARVGLACEIQNYGFVDHDLSLVRMTSPQQGDTTELYLTATSFSPPDMPRHATKWDRGSSISA